MTKTPKYKLPFEVMEKYIKKIEKKWLSQIFISSMSVNRPERGLYWDIINNITDYDLFLIKREWPKKPKRK